MPKLPFHDVGVLKFGSVMLMVAVGVPGGGNVCT